MPDFSIILQRHTAVTQHSVVIYGKQLYTPKKTNIQVIKRMFHQGCLYQASLPPVKFQMPAQNPNSVYSCTSPGGDSHLKGEGMPVRNFELNP